MDMGWPLGPRMFYWNLMMTVSVVKRGRMDTMEMSTTIVKYQTHNYNHNDDNTTSAIARCFISACQSQTQMVVGY